MAQIAIQEQIKVSLILVRFPPLENPTFYSDYVSAVQDLDNIFESVLRSVIGNN